MVKNQINMFWSGDNFTEMHRMCVLSHVVHNHRVIMWLHGARPLSIYWIADVPEVIIKNADEICNIDNWLASGGNLKTGSFLWRSNLLLKQGGWYADCDAYCCAEWPRDPWCIVTGENKGSDLISNGVIKAPKNHQIFKDCITNAQKDWGNVIVFTTTFKNFFGHTESTHPDHLFYPFTYKELKEKRILEAYMDIPKVFSIHLYHTVVEREKIRLIEDSLLDKMFVEVEKYFQVRSKK